MPEGHTIHRLAGVFARCFVGRVVAASSPQRRFAGGAAALDERRMATAEARGKHLFLGFEGGDAPVWLRVHLGLYGGWRFAGPGLAGESGRAAGAPGVGRGGAADARRFVAASSGGEGERGGDGGAEDVWPPAPRGLVRLRLLAGDRVADLSGPAACVLETPEGRAAAMARLGEDPLREGADADAAGRDVTEAEWRALWADLRALMQDGVARGRIVTTRPEHRAAGRGGAGRGGAVRRGEASYVAHRAGQPCRVCGTAVRAEEMAGRTLYWCEACQPT